MKTILEVLQESRKLIECGWCQGNLAQDSHGYAISNPKAPAACRWCLEGAVEAAADNTILADEVLEELRFQSGEKFLFKFNDRPTTTQEDILNLIDKTIDKLS